MEKVRSWVGLDVHAHRSVVCVIDGGSGELTRRRLSVPAAGIVEFLAGLPAPVRAVYEAGPTGYGLVRLAEAGALDVRVAAPGLIPRRPADRVKTDARDAERLARLLMAGELAFVRVPTLEEERLRDLVRAREDVRQDLMRARHRLSKFLLRHQRRFPGRAGAWTTLHMRWLRDMRFDEPASQAVMVDYLAAVEGLLQRRVALEAQIAATAEAEAFRDPVGKLRAFRGIDTLSSAGLVAEIGRFDRFPNPAKLGDYLGICPSEHTSDTKRRLGAITKAGPSHARRLLIEAAWHYRHPPRINESLAKRQEGIDPRVCQIAWRAQRRLHQRWLRLHHQRNKPGGVVAVACARELACFLWEAATLN
jgi:transposase